MAQAASKIPDSDPNLPLLLVEDLFLEGLIRSALLDPKLYGLIPETATLRCVCGVLLLKILQAKLHLEDGLGRIDERVASHLKSNPVFNIIPAQNLLQQLASPPANAPATRFTPHDRPL
jgi:hypothetical protein